MAIEFCTNATLLRAPIRHLIVGDRRCTHHVFDRCGEQAAARVDPRRLSLRAGGREIMALRDLRRRCGTRRPAFVFNFVLMTQNIHEATAFVRMAQMLGAESIGFPASGADRHLLFAR